MTLLPGPITPEQMRTARDRYDRCNCGCGLTRALCRDQDPILIRARAKLAAAIAADPVRAAAAEKLVAIHADNLRIVKARLHLESPLRRELRAIRDRCSGCGAHKVMQQHDEVCPTIWEP